MRAAFPPLPFAAPPTRFSSGHIYDNILATAAPTAELSSVRVQQVRLAVSVCTRCVCNGCAGSFSSHTPPLMRPAVFCILDAAVITNPMRMLMGSPGSNLHHIRCSASILQQKNLGSFVRAMWHFFVTKLLSTLLNSA